MNEEKTMLLPQLMNICNSQSEDEFMKYIEHIHNVLLKRVHDENLSFELIEITSYQIFHQLFLTLKREKKEIEKE